MKNRHLKQIAPLSILNISYSQVGVNIEHFFDPSYAVDKIKNLALHISPRIYEMRLQSIVNIIQTLPYNIC